MSVWTFVLSLSLSFKLLALLLVQNSKTLVDPHEVFSVQAISDRALSQRAQFDCYQTQVLELGFRSALGLITFLLAPFGNVYF